MTQLVEFTLTVSLNKNGEPEFNYTQDGIPATGSFVVNGPTTVRYNLIDLTNKELVLIGAAFTNPFSNVIDTVKVTNDNDNQYIDLIDVDAAPGKTGFRFVLQPKNSTLLMLSPDPEIINRGQG